MSPETRDALNTLILYILRCTAHLSKHVLLRVLRERICTGTGTCTTTEGNIHEEENNYQRQPVQMTQEWCIAGLICSGGWRQVQDWPFSMTCIPGRTPDLLLVLNKPTVLCYTPAITYTHLESGQLGPAPRHRGSKPIFPVLLLVSSIYRRC